MNPLAIACTPSACDASLSIGQILAYGVARAPAQEIVYGDRLRYTYKTLAERVNCLASALAALGVEPGATVAIMDWDSHRYLECFFAVPMMGAVLHTVNVRISPEQVLYTINHAKDDVILVNAEFLLLLEGSRAKSRPGVRVVLINDGAAVASGAIEFAAEYESMPPPPHPPTNSQRSPRTPVRPRSTRPGPRVCRRASTTAIDSSCCTRSASPGLCSRTARIVRCARRLMPVTPMFHVHAWGLPYVATLLGVKQVYPGRYVPDVLLGLIAREGVTFSHCVPTILQMLLASPALREGSLRGWKMVIGGSALPLPLAAPRSTRASISLPAMGCRRPARSSRSRTSRRNFWRETRSSAFRFCAGRGARSRSCSCASSMRR
jgi:fatty-acyl-CoA synthase